MKTTILSAALMVASFTTFAQVGVGTTTPNASAVLDVTSTTRGFLLPRMTEVQMNAIVSPVEGLMVYCNNCFPKGTYQYDGFLFQGLTYNGSSNFTTVTSTTGKIWLDRNMGAVQVATSSTDADSYGGLYQWGRNTDGHEIRTSSTIAGPVASGNEGANFILSTSDWLITPDNTRWFGATKGTNDPCPTGYRVPTETELNVERLAFSSNNAAGAFASPLKLPVAGFRYGDGTLQLAGTDGLYYSSTVNGAFIRYLYFASSLTAMGNVDRGNAGSVRCIQE